MRGFGVSHRGVLTSHVLKDRARGRRDALAGARPAGTHYPTFKPGTARRALHRWPRTPCTAFSSMFGRAPVSVEDARGPRSGSVLGIRARGPRCDRSWRVRRGSRSGLFGPRSGFGSWSESRGSLYAPVLRIRGRVGRARGRTRALPRFHAVHLPLRPEAQLARRCQRLHAPLAKRTSNKRLWSRNPEGHAGHS